MANRVLFTINVAVRLSDKSDKVKWPQIGAIIQTDNGKTFGRLDTIPLCSSTGTAPWDGKFQLFTPKAQREAPDTDKAPDETEF